MESDISPDRELDARGLNCPLPILRTKKALNEMAGGQTLHVVATDPGSVRDFQAFARQTGHASINVLRVYDRRVDDALRRAVDGSLRLPPRDHAWAHCA